MFYRGGYNTPLNGLVQFLRTLLSGGGLLRKYYFLFFILRPQRQEGWFSVQSYSVFLKRGTITTGFCEKVGKNVCGETGKRRRARLLVGQAGGRGVVVFG